MSDQIALVPLDLVGGCLVAPLGFVASGLRAHLIYRKNSARDPQLVRFRDRLFDEMERDLPTRCDRRRASDAAVTPSQA